MPEYIYRAVDENGATVYVEVAAPCAAEVLAEADEAGHAGPVVYRMVDDILAEDDDAEAAPPREQNEKPLSGRRILVVDDSSSMRRMLDSLFSAAGAKVIEASDGLSALDTLQRSIKQDKPFSLVIIDIRMPGLGGVGLLREIRNDEAIAHLPVIVVTAQRTSDIVRDCAALGIAGYIVKPLNTHKMLDMVKNIFGLGGGTAG